jgi:hypothetical protein
MKIQKQAQEERQRTSARHWDPLLLLLLLPPPVLLPPLPLLLLQQPPQPSHVAAAAPALPTLHVLAAHAARGGHWQRNCWRRAWAAAFCCCRRRSLLLLLCYGLPLWLITRRLPTGDAAPL